MTDEKIMAMTNAEKYAELLKIYNEMEGLFKSSQLIQNMFEISVLNEFRYISRAMVEYSQGFGDTKKESNALAKLEVSISAAFNDIVDCILLTIENQIRNYQKVFPSDVCSIVLNKYDYKSLLPKIRDMNKKIIESRKKRSKRSEIYKTLANSEIYKAIIDFGLNLKVIEYELELEIGDIYTTYNPNYIGYVENAINERGQSEFFMLFQPKFNTSIQIIGAEALVRLRYYEYLEDNLDNIKSCKDDNINYEIVTIEGKDKIKCTKIMPQPILLDIIENCGYKEALDHIVLKKTMKKITELKPLLEKLENFRISFNVFPNTISKMDFIDKLNELAIKNEIERYLTLEILESWREEKEEHIKTHFYLSNLNSKINISIDDFGSGSTKLDFLISISNISEIKIDKRLTDLLLSNNRNMAEKLILGIVHLAESCEFDIIVEGVEKEEQFNFLKKIGVHKFQGYYKELKPKEFDVFKELLNKEINKV